MKKINWLDHLANLLVVILGISIAFYLESYKEQESARLHERQYVESLIKDLETDIGYLDTLRVGNRRISEALINLSNASVGMYTYESDTELMNNMLAIQYNPSFSPQTTTYESLKATGKMDLISSFEERNALIELYEQFYRGTNEYDAAINEHLRDFIRPFYIKNIRFNSARSINSDFLPKSEFRNMIFAYRYLFIAKDEFYAKVRARAEEVKYEFENHLKNLQ